MVFLAIYFTASGWFFPPCLSYHPHYQALDHGLPEEIQEYGEYSHYNPYHAEMVVDSKGRYLLEYTVDYNAKTITFNLTVHTTGWVGIGLSKDGTMKDADIMVGWVDSYDHGYLMVRNPNVKLEKHFIIVLFYTIHRIYIQTTTESFSRIPSRIGTWLIPAKRMAIPTWL